MACFRSQDRNSEGGTLARQLSTEFRDGTNSAVGNLQRGQPSCVDFHIEILNSFFNDVAEYLLQMQKTFRNLMARLSCFAVLIVDPSFSYIEVINADKKCIAFDKKVGIVCCIVLRSISDFLCLIYVTIPLWAYSHKLTSSRLIKIWRKLSHLMFLFCVLSILPVQQVLISLVFTKRITGWGINSAMQIIGLQILLRNVFMFYFAFPASVFSSSAGRWTFTFLYTYVAYLFAAIWYGQAINEVSNCWKKACFHTGCRIRYCDESLNNYMQNTTIFCNLGLYDDIINYKFDEVTDFPRKLIFCLRWSFQSLSSFGQNLQPNGAVSQNVFAIMISIWGVLLFGACIIFMQRSLLSLQKRREKRDRKIKQIQNSIPFKKLSKNLQSQVKDAKHRSFSQEIRDTKGTDVMNFFSNLSEDLTKEIKRELCLELLKKVKQFEKWSEALLEELCDCVKPISYAKGTYIIRDREAIDEMLFLVQGKLRTYSFRSVNIGSTKTARRRSITNILKEGEFYGEELVTWFQANPYLCDLPISTKNVRTLTKIDGFALLADDLKIILIKQHKAVFIQAYWCFTMMKKHQRIEDQTSTQDQTSPTKSMPQLSLEINVQQL